MNFTQVGWVRVGIDQRGEPRFAKILLAGRLSDGEDECSFDAPMCQAAA